MGLEQRFLSVPRERLDPHLLPESGAHRLHFLGPDENDRQAGASVPRSPPREMLRQPLRQILGDAGVERAVAAAEDVDEGHGGMIAGRLLRPMLYFLSMTMRLPQVGQSGPFRADQLRPGDSYELSDGHPIRCLPTGSRGGRAPSVGDGVLASDP